MGKEAVWKNGDGEGDAAKYFCARSAINAVFNLHVGWLGITEPGGGGAENKWTVLKNKKLNRSITLKFIFIIQPDIQ